MTEYQLLDDCYVLPTPAGAYYATAAEVDEPARRLLLALLGENQSQLLSVPQLARWTGIKNQQDILELLYRIQTLGWIQGETDTQQSPPGTLEDTLPELLACFSGSGKALLSDHQGFYLATHGFTHETAEELSALGADIAALHKRHSRLLNNNVGLDSSAWAIVDAAGHSEIGFWPLYLGKQQFVLALSGIPHLNQLAFVQLVWALAKRYNAMRNSTVTAIQLNSG